MALIADVRAAVRALVAAPGFVSIAALTLASGLALAGAILTVVNVYLLRGLPYPAAERLYRVDYAAPNQSPPRGLAQLDWAQLDDVTELQVAWDLDVFYVLGDDYPESAPGAWITPDYLNALGVRVNLGRLFGPADYQSGAAPTALISHRLWQTQFGSDPHIVGRTFSAYVSDRPNEAETFTIVGVLAEDLWHLNVYTEVLAPLKVATYPYQVRLRPDVTAQMAVERIDRLVRRGLSSAPESYRLSLTSLHDSYVAGVRPVLWAVIAAAVLILVIASANVAVLMIVRARRRERETAVRLALGASHGRVARMLALEGLLVGSVSLLLGLAIVSAALPLLGPVVERALDRRMPGGVAQFAIDARVIAMMVVSGVVVTIVLALIPLMTLWGSTVSRGLTGRGVTDGRQSGRSRAVLIAVEVAASLALVVGAALMGETAIRMLRVDFGIAADRVVTAGLALRQRTFPDESTRAAFFARVERELPAVAGTTAVALGDWWPLQGSQPRRVESGGQVATANPFGVSSEYFSTLGIRLREGRAFDARDRLESEPVVIVSESLAARLWPGGGAVGQRVTIQSDGERPTATALVVGVASDVRQSHTDTDLFDAYLPIAQRAGRFAFLYVRAPLSSRLEADLRAAIARIDREVALSTLRPLDTGLEQERARPRFLAQLLTAFAALACVLALIGMHGVIAYAVRQRQREIAVRMALGADRRAIVALFLRYGAVVLGAGLTAGTLGGIALGRILQSQLYGVRAAEPRLFVLASLTFGVVAIVAILAPARRAAALDPVPVLKSE